MAKRCCRCGEPVVETRGTRTPSRGSFRGYCKRCRGIDRKLETEQQVPKGGAALGYPRYIWDYLLTEWDVAEDAWYADKQ